MKDKAMYTAKIEIEDKWKGHLEMGDINQIILDALQKRGLNVTKIKTVLVAHCTQTGILFIHEDGIKCFDHRGIQAKRIEEEIDLGLKEKKKRPLPIRNKPAPESPSEMPPQAPKLKPQLNLLKFTDWMPKASNENLYIR